MRLKGISPFEQHVEKIVAGVFALALLAVLALQFLTKPSTVKVGTSEVPPPEAYEKMARDAKIVDDRIRSANPDMPGGASAVTQSFDHFAEKLTAPVSPKPELAVALDAPSNLGAVVSGVSGSANTAVSELKVPAPTHALAATNMSTIAASEQQQPDVAKVLPAAPPFDKASVSVEAVFDGTALKTALAEDPDGAAGPIRAIPSNWYSSGVQILGVELHREMLKPDGTWSADEKVKQLPGRSLYVDDADKLNDAAALSAAAKFATDQSDLIRRTPYYDSSFGDKWFAPAEREARVDADADRTSQIAREKHIFSEAEKMIKNLQDQLAKVGQTTSPSPGAGGGGGGGRGGGKGGSRGGGGSPPPSGPLGPSAGDEARRKQLGLAITRQQEKLDQAKAKLRALGEPVEGDTTSEPMDPNAKPKAEPAVLDNNAIKLWAHDVFVERGKTYRYQVVVILTNPYFGHSAAMVPAQAEKLAKTGIMRSAASDWTDPVTVDPETYLFFTGATQDDPSTGRTATARAEVYQFKWGYWRRGATTLEPGDMVTADIRIPDFTKIMAAPPDPNQPQMPTSAPHGRGKFGGGGPAPTPPPTNSGAPTLPAGTPPPMITVPVESQQIMIGVGEGQIRDSSGNPKVSEEVYIREKDGEIKAIVPDSQRLDPAYARVSHSADKGLRELNPAPEKPRSQQPGQNPNFPNDRDGRGPGGGAGGG